MKTWKLLSGLFTLMSSFFVGFSGLVLGLDQAFKHESDKGESDGIFLAFFMFFGGLVSIFLRKSKVGGNIAIIILHAIIALIGFQSDATKYHIVGAWGLLCAAIAAYSLYQHYRGDKQTKEATTNKQVQKVMSNRQCPYCHAAVPSGSAFCGSCGKELPKEIVCPQCGASVDVNAQFCSNCGKNLSTDSVEEAVTSQSETVYEEEGENPIRKYLPYILGAIALIVICGGGWWYFNSSKAPQSNNEVAVAEAVEADSIAVEDTEKTSERDIKLITEWYDYVFGKKEISDDVLDKFLSSKVKKSLWTEDYDGCYEYWKFRTIAQDYDPNVGDISKIEDISVNSDGWYEVKYLDMGYKGKTSIKIDNTKIIGFVPDSSWSNNESSVENRADNETIADDNSDNSSSTYNSSTTTSSSSRTFYSEQIVIGYLANQSFRASDGLNMRVDGDGRLYVDGDYAGVLSVLRYSSTAALLRYGGGQYGEGKLSVQIVGDKFQLADPTDGTIYYQK